uniref:Uncharacterized protein n=1 Tax=Podarcis muralis TaxID=64176 RepID=A0A670HT39_PODMU
MRTLRRLKFMSSPSLSDLGKREPASLDERGTQQRRACSNATWNRYGLAYPPRTQAGRQLLKTELGSFFTEYLQNQLLTKGIRNEVGLAHQLWKRQPPVWLFTFCLKL